MNEFQRDSWVYICPECATLNVRSDPYTGSPANHVCTKCDSELDHISVWTGRTSEQQAAAVDDIRREQEWARANPQHALVDEMRRRLSQLTHYEVISVEAGASTREILQEAKGCTAYRILRQSNKRYTPGEMATWRSALDESVSVLIDPQRRAKYDRTLLGESQLGDAVKTSLGAGRILRTALAVAGILLVVGAMPRDDPYGYPGVQRQAFSPDWLIAGFMTMALAALMHRWRVPDGLVARWITRRRLAGRSDTVQRVVSTFVLWGLSLGVIVGTALALRYV